MKIAVISLSEETHWQSCRLITAGLREAYDQLPKRFEILNIEISQAASRRGCGAIVQNLVASAPDLIVFLDTFRVYGVLLGEMAEQLSKFKKPPGLRFHAYGDFTLKSYEWLSWETHLKKFSVEWMCASEKQKNLVAAQMMPDQNVVSVCPFPLYRNRMTFRASERKRLRKDLRLGESDRLVLYTGRLSLQKNVVAVVKAFAELAPSQLASSVLIFAGEFDDIGAPFNNVQLGRGGFFALFSETLNHLSPTVRERIKVLRGLPQTALSTLYSAADAFISLSLQHDEDFGMAPAEAATAGLPVILTDWGGYSAFQSLGLKGQWIPVELNDHGPAFKIRDATEALEGVLEQHHSHERRAVRGDQAATALSMSRATRFLSNAALPQEKFRGFQSSIAEMAERYSPDCGYLIFDSTAKGSLYEKIYKNYV